MTALRPTAETYIAYSPINDRPQVVWPGGKRVAVWIAPNIEHYEFVPPRQYIPVPPSRPHPHIPFYALRDGGNRAAFWRMIDVFDRHGVQATASLNVAVLQLFPEICKAMVDRNWEFMSHGVFNTQLLYDMSEDDERAFYRDCQRVVLDHTGTTMKGMLGPRFTATPNTPRLMAEAGLTYQADWFIDDQPFPIQVPAGRLVGVPYSRHLNDVFAFGSGRWLSGPEWVRMCRDQFDVLYEEGANSGRVMCIPLHPFIIGTPHRAKYLDEVLGYVMSFDGTWQTTAASIADWYIAHHYDAQVGHAASIGGSHGG